MLLFADYIALIAESDQDRQMILIIVAEVIAITREKQDKNASMQ